MSAINVPVIVPDIDICKGCKFLDIEEVSICAKGKVVIKQQSCSNSDLCEYVINRCEVKFKETEIDGL